MKTVFPIGNNSIPRLAILPLAFMLADPEMGQQAGHIPGEEVHRKRLLGAGREQEHSDSRLPSRRKKRKRMVRQWFGRIDHCRCFLPRKSQEDFMKKWGINLTKSKVKYTIGAMSRLWGVDYV